MPMDVQANLAAWPELQEFWEAFQGCFRRPQSRHALACAPKGLLTPQPHTHGDPIAQDAPGTGAQRWPEFLPHLLGKEISP
jgi:hypothetical protein